MTVFLPGYLWQKLKGDRDRNRQRQRETVRERMGNKQRKTKRKKQGKKKDRDKGKDKDKEKMNEWGCASQYFITLKEDIWKTTWRKNVFWFKASGALLTSNCCVAFDLWQIIPRKHPSLTVALSLEFQKSREYIFKEYFPIN